MTKVEKIDSNKMLLEVEVSEPEVETALAKAYKKVVKRINIPGFRKGRVPRRVLEARFGPEILYEDALNLIIPQAFERAVDETEIEPIDQPDVEVIQMEKGKPLLFKATVEVKPEVKLGEYKGIEIEKKEVKITEEEINNHLEELRKSHALLITVEEGVVENGSFVIIDFTGYIDGAPFEGGEAENYSLEIGSGSFIPGFEDQLIGAKTGEKKEVNVTFPGDYHQKEFAGKDAIFKVKINEVKHRELPKLNDDFVKEISNYDTLEEFKDDVKNKLEKEKEKQQMTEFEIALIDKISDNSEIEVPESMVNREIDRRLREMEFYLKAQGMDLNKFLEYSGKEISELKEENREEAVKRIRGNLIIDAIIKKEDIETDAEELNERIKEMAKGYQKEPAEMKEFLIKQGQMERVKGELLYRKTVDFLVSNAKVKVIEDGSKYS